MFVTRVSQTRSRYAVLVVTILERLGIRLAISNQEAIEMDRMATLDSEIFAPPVPAQAEVRYRIEVLFRCAITPFVARQNANVYLLMNVGNMLSSREDR